MINWSSINDGTKYARFGASSMWELEAGLKLEKVLTFAESDAKWYIKPSVIKTFAGNDKVRISGLENVHSLDDNTLGRISGGITYYISDRLNLYGNAGYTFGDDYKNISADVGLKFAF